MKTKFFFIALAAMLAIPTMQAQRNATNKAATMQSRIENRHMDNAVATQNHFRVTLNDEAIPEGMARVTLACGDVWTDGTGYQMLLDADATAYGNEIPEIGGLSSFGDADPAVYAAFEYKIPENADGSIYTENIVLNNSISILIPAGVYDYCITNPTPYDRIWIASSYGDVDGRADDYEFKAGFDYVFTVEMTYYGYDGVFLTVTGQEEPVVVPTTPEEVNVVPGRYDANVSWIDEDDAMWNLRYRVYDPEATGIGETYFWDFEDAQTDDYALPGGWTCIDNDGDSFGWYHLNTVSDGGWACHSGDGHVTSASYNMWGALLPDNWLVSPKVTLSGNVSFWAAGQDPDWADEVFAVYVTTGDPNDVNGYVKISDDITVTGDVTEYTFDLSEYAGMEGYVAIRHYNVTDMFRLNIDDVTIGGGETAPAAEWIYVYGIEALNYMINGLEQETTYEVQVQATDGQAVSDWTEPYYFTTTGNTSIDEVNAEVKGDNTYYNLMGQKMDANNLPAGIYINNGKKVVVK